jgi:methylase of polypeptide subunit release factors
MIADEIQTLEWAGCYDSGWAGFITDESFCHPAKMAYGLTERIIKHGFEQGYWKANDLIGDPFSGVGCVGIMAAAHGLRYIGVELEPRFCALANRNFQLNPWTRNGEARIIQGDSRNFASLVGQCQSVVTSPPFAGSSLDGVDTNPERMMNGPCASTSHGGGKARYAPTNSPGQLASLPVGDVGAILTSPPYAGSTTVDGRGITDHQTHTRDIGDIDELNHGYGVTEGQLGAMPAGDISSVITSPPWETNADVHAQRYATGLDPQKSNWPQNRSAEYIERRLDGYGKSANQLGNTSGDTYWGAVKVIYEQCFLALKPGGYIAVVVKSYVKAGKIVPLPEQTWELLRHVGFEPVERVRAMLVKEDSHPGLFNGPVVKKTERKSFFRRLAEKKGSPAIDFEEVLFLRKPL